MSHGRCVASFDDRPSFHVLLLSQQEALPCFPYHIYIWSMAFRPAQSRAMLSRDTDQPTNPSAAYFPLIEPHNVQAPPSPPLCLYLELTLAIYTVSNYDDDDDDAMICPLSAPPHLGPPPGAPSMPPCRDKNKQPKDGRRANQSIHFARPNVRNNTKTPPHPTHIHTHPHTHTYLPTWLWLWNSAKRKPAREVSLRYFSAQRETHPSSPSSIFLLRNRCSCFFVKLWCGSSEWSVSVGCAGGLGRRRGLGPFFALVAIDDDDDDEDGAGQHRLSRHVQSMNCRRVVE